MPRQTPPITIVPFVPPQFLEEFHSCLKTLGYEADVVNHHDWLENRQQLREDITVLLLGDHAVSPKTILAALERYKHRVNLGVFDCKQRDWDPRLLNCCTEFLGWPCHERELKLRLGRLIPDPLATGHKPDEAFIIEEFVGLNLVGRSPVFLKVLRQIKKIARCDAPVLIEGETGTGKELAARAIHYLGARRDYPFIPVNCGAIPDTLVESELFGHKRGAFTDAKETHTGVVEQAQGGTLFLDEIDTLSTKAQVTLLRFLQDQEYKPLGGKRLRKADVRIIAATNTDLPAMVKQGHFRHDLLYRLNIISIRMPPLRERAGDARILAEHFSAYYESRYQRKVKRLHPDLLAWLERHDWPGNVRELENLIHREYLLSDGDSIGGQTIGDINKDRRKNGIDRRKQRFFNLDMSKAKAQLIVEFEKKYLCWLMRETHGNVTLAAKRAGKERRALGKLLKKYGLDRSDFIHEAS